MGAGDTEVALPFCGDKSELNGAKSALRRDFIHVGTITFHDSVNGIQRRFFQRPKFRRPHRERELGDGFFQGGNAGLRRGADHFFARRVNQCGLHLHVRRRFITAFKRGFNRNRPLAVGISNRVGVDGADRPLRGLGSLGPAIHGHDHMIGLGFILDLQARRIAGDRVEGIPHAP